MIYKDRMKKVTTETTVILRLHLLIRAKFLTRILIQIATLSGHWPVKVPAQPPPIYRFPVAKILFTVQKVFHKSFPLRISSVNVTKSAGNCGFGHIYSKIFNGKLHFLCSVIDLLKCKQIIINEMFHHITFSG